MILENGPVQIRRGVDEPDERLAVPSLNDRKLKQPFVRESRSPQHLLVGISIHGLFPPLWHSVAGADCVPPPLECVVQDTLPSLIAPPGCPAPQERNTAAFGKVAHQAPRNGIAIEPMKRVPDSDEVEGPLKRHVLSRRSSPLDVRNSETLRFALAELDRLCFLINSAHIGEIRRQGERDLASATGKVEQPRCVA